MDDAPSRFTTAAQRWVALLNGYGRADDATAAVSDDVRIDRFGFGPNSGRLVERIHGTKHVCAWAEMSPQPARFELVGPVTVALDGQAPTGSARYRVFAPGFENFGHWAFRLAEDGRIRWLAHAPDDLEGAHPEGRHGAEWRALLIWDDEAPPPLDGDDGEGSDG